jgi:hypothetical protein
MCPVRAPSGSPLKFGRKQCPTGTTAATPDHPHIRRERAIQVHEFVPSDGPAGQVSVPGAALVPFPSLDATAEMFGLSIEDLRGKSRSRPLVPARQIAMYVLREMTDFSYPAIGREFGDRDHTTVMHAVTKISTLMAERRAIYDQVTELMTRLKTGC